MSDATFWKAARKRFLCSQDMHQELEKLRRQRDEESDAAEVARIKTQEQEKMMNLQAKIIENLQGKIETGEKTFEKILQEATTSCELMKAIIARLEGKSVAAIET